jgi:hypothetical protein
LDPYIHEGVAVHLQGYPTNCPIGTGSEG